MDTRLAVLRRIYERYHDQGLDVILSVSTQGYRWGSPPLEPEKEAKILGWYFREYLRLPFSILVEETQFDRLPDGRRMPKPAEQTMMSGLIGRDGTIRGFPSQLSEEELDAYVRRELARSR